MSDLFSEIDKARKFADALEQGLHKFIGAVPALINQQIRALAQKNLNTTFDAYMDAISVRMEQYVLVVSLDPDNWLANAVESGVGEFDMKEGLLKSPKAKMSAKGHRYMHVPMSKSKNASPGTEKGQQMQQKILDALNTKRFGASKIRPVGAGRPEVTEIQEVNPGGDLGGLYRIRQFESAQSYIEKKQKPTWQYVLFRTVSENPESKTGATWQHPGIKAQKLFPEAEKWAVQTLPAILETFIEQEYINSLSKP